MKNDFDFIKEKFDTDGVKAPDSITENTVFAQLDGVKPVKVKKSKKGMVIGITSAAAASVAVITAGAFIAANVLSQPIGTPVAISGTAKLMQFNTRDEIRQAVGDAIQFQNNLNNYGVIDGGDWYEALDGAAAGNSEKVFSAESAVGSASGSSGGSSSHNSTYVQHTGVDEADNIKTDSEYIYYLSPTSNGMRNQIQIYRAAQKDTELVSEITELNDNNFREFYVNGDRLVILSQNYYRDSVTEAAVYDITDRSAPKLMDSFSQSGSYVSSRMIGDTLYMVSDYYANREDYMPSTYYRNATPDEVPVSCTYSVETPANSNFLVVSSVDTKDGAKALSTKSILGSAEDVYCNQDYLYVTASEYEAQDYSNVINRFASLYKPTTVKTQIVKFSLNDSLDAVASCYVNGQVNNQYSLDEHNGNLRVATTSINELTDYDVNNLYVLDSGLNQIGAVEGFAENESIKAVRYMGDTAYVITYEQTDPLFVIDLTNPSDPQILGEVKISGFSTMLVPVDENTVLGIGYNTDEYYYTDMEVQDGIKIVTFDVTDKTNPQVKDTKVFKNYNSAVQYNPKALLVNPERNDYTIPFAYYSGYYSDGNSYSGVINFKVTDGKIDIVDEYRSDVFASNDSVSTEVDRCVYIGNTIYMLGEKWNYGSVDSIENAYDIYRTAIDCVEYK